MTGFPWARQPAQWRPRQPREARLPPRARLTIRDNDSKFASSALTSTSSRSLLQSSLTCSERAKSGTEWHSSCIAWHGLLSRYAVTATLAHQPTEVRDLRTRGVWPESPHELLLHPRTLRRRQVAAWTSNADAARTSLAHEPCSNWLTGDATVATTVSDHLSESNGA